VNTFSTDHWRRTTFGRFARVLNGADYGSIEVENGGYPVYGSGGAFRQASDYLYSGESVLFGRKGTIDAPLYVDGKFWTVDTMFYTDIDRRSLLPRFAYYWALTLPFRAWATDTALPSMTSTAIKAAPLLLPPLEQQRVIADYLDRETARIDAFIAKNEVLITLLTERRAATIGRAVTKGIDGGAVLTECEVPWAGDIPETWDSGSIRRFALMKTGHTPSRQHSEYWVDCTIPWFTLADVWQLRAGAKHLGETNERISHIGLANSAAELLPAGTVVLSRTASVGFTGIMPTAMATSQDYWNWIPKTGLRPEFLWYQFQAMRPEFERLMMGSTHRTIYQADAASLRIVVPPVEVQDQIVEYLDRTTKKTDAEISAARRAIDLARERRAALISAAVTGKIDVGVAA
jgi:type I restriction enzyme S subunit